MNQELLDRIDKDNDNEDEENRSIVLAPRDRFDSAIIGYENKRVVYSEEAIIQIYMEDGMTEEQAIDFYEFNTKGAYMGKYNPIYKSENYEEELWN
jgi:hypothetical protein